MNKLEIICYIVSAFFAGISAGSLISMGVHRSIYKRKNSPREDATFKATAPDLCKENAIHEAAVLDLRKEVKPVTPFFGCYEEERFLPCINESPRAREEQELRMKHIATYKLLGELKEAGAIRYDIKVSEHNELRTQRVLCVAKLNVAMPEKKEAQQ